MEIKYIWGAEEKRCGHTISNTTKAPISHADVTSVPTQCSKRPFRVMVRAHWVPLLLSLQAAVHLRLFIPTSLLLILHVFTCLIYMESWSYRGRIRRRHAESQSVYLVPSIAAYNQNVFWVGIFLCSFSTWENMIIQSSLQDIVTSSQKFSIVFSCTEKNAKRTGIIFNCHKF